MLISPGHKIVPSLGLILLTLGLTACSSGQTADTSTIETDTVMKEQLATTLLPTIQPTKSLIPIPIITPTASSSDPSDSIECAFSKHLLNVSCKAPRGISGQWMSNATAHRSKGSTFEFSLESQVSEIVVELEVCTPEPCHVMTAIIESPSLGTVDQETVFWNERPNNLPECTSDFRFSHQLANPEDVLQLMFGPGSHIEPHEHMLYWESGTAKEIETVPGTKKQVSRKIQLYAPTDIYRIHVGETNRSTEEGDTYIEWGGYLYTCDGHQLMLGHIGEPSDEVEAILADTEPTCGQLSGAAREGELGCTWVTDTVIPSGTPLFKSSGYAGAFDFGLSLFGLTAEQLQEQPGYGYSITPWRVASGRAVCALEYFPEPFRSEYLKRLRDSATGELLECGPFNQDVPGTAMGFWLPSPSPESVPLQESERRVDEWDTLWLFMDNTDSSTHIISVGNNTFGLDYGQYAIHTVSEGLVNRNWDSVVPGPTYCAELRESWSDSYESIVQKTIVMQVSENGKSFTIEAQENGKCGNGPWDFQGNERRFYR